MFNSLQMPHDERLPIITQFVIDKLSSGTDGHSTFDMHIAWLAIRIMLKLDTSNDISQKIQSKLVQSFLRLVIYVPSDRVSIETDAPSEPILAEAVAQLIHHSSSFNGFETLELALEKNLLARRDCGKAGIRLFCILAYDRAVSCRPTIASGLTYHRPVRLLDFLRALFVTDVHEEIFGATPIDDDLCHKTSAITLSTAFKDAWLHFSHFSLAGDHLVTQIPTLCQFFLRGTALQCCDKQCTLDNIAPLAFAETEDTVLCADNFSYFGQRIENRKIAGHDVLHTDAFIPPTFTAKHPIISILFELGEENTAPEVINTIEVVHSADSTCYGNQQLHYQITVHGLDALEMSQKDRAGLHCILAPRNDLEGFPRTDPENLELVQLCKPRFKQLGDDGKDDASMKAWSHYHMDHR